MVWNNNLRSIGISSARSAGAQPGDGRELRGARRGHDHLLSVLRLPCLRHDNADLRLTDIGHEIGLISDERYAKFVQKRQDIEDEKKRLESIRIKPNPEIDAYLEAHGDKALKDGVLASDMLRRPYMSYQDLLKFIPAPDHELDKRVIEQIEIQYKYEGYIKKAEEKVEKLHRMEAKKIPANIDYKAIDGLATEAVEKLTKIQPETLAQASRISGVNPADISILAVYIQQGRIAKKTEE